MKDLTNDAEGKKNDTKEEVVELSSQGEDYGFVSDAGKYHLKAALQVIPQKAAIVHICGWLAVYDWPAFRHEMGLVLKFDLASRSQAS